MYGCVCCACVPDFHVAARIRDDRIRVSAGVQKRSFLLLLDASNMKEVARAWTKDPVALGFHGHFGKLDEFKQQEQQQQQKASVL